MCALQAARQIAALRRARPDTTNKIRWCPAYKGVPGNEKTDGWAKPAAEEPDARGVGYSDGAEVWAMPLRRPLARLEREKSEKWAEARQWYGGRASSRKHNMPSRQKQDGAVAGGSIKTRLWVLPAEDRSLPHRAVPELGEEPTHRSVLVVLAGCRRGVTSSARTADWKRTVHNLAMIYLVRSHAGND